MALKPGEQLGPYEILALLGKGGMGEVYRARDPRLQRDVAIKTSAQRFSERFEREARVIAALNHPNICQIYDVGPNYIVMELVDGVPPKGPLSVAETERIAEQIMSALEAAHEKAITHRDLKPANILLRADGVIKVLDFGLAKIDSRNREASEADATLTLGGTVAGTILGTAAYMAPEQARGKEVDNRADIWAFGVIVHELLTGKRLFDGADLTETLASVVKDQPDLNVIPRRLRRLVGACLQKDPAKRLQTIADGRLLLDAEDEPRVEPLSAPSRSRFGVWAGGAAALFAITTGIALWAPWRSAPAEPESVQFSIAAPEDMRFGNQYGSFSVSPDGRHIAFYGQGKDGNLLWLRSLDSMVARPIPGTGSSNFTFWSPDSKSLAFTSNSDGKLKRVDISGGAPLTLADVSGTDISVTSTGTWNAEGVILFGSGTGLQRVLASGGGASPLTKIEGKETGHGYPQFLPDGKRFLYFVMSNDASVQGVYASSLDDPKQRIQVVRTDAKAVYVPPRGSQPGYLLWMQENSLVAQRFDVDTLQRQGDPTSVAENIGRNAANPVRAAFWASDAGLLGYLTGGTQDTRRIVWMSRDGKLLGDALPEAAMVTPTLSLDGTRLAVERRDNSAGDVGVWEFARSVATRLTFEPEREQLPVWSPDGRQIAYQRIGVGLLRKDASGAGQPQMVLDSTAGLPLDWSRDGKYILYRTQGETTGRDLWAAPVSADGAEKAKPFPVVVGPAAQSTGRFSPDGKWIAYGSDESGIFEVYIQPFVQPESTARPGGRWQVSNTSGVNIVWRKDSRELYYDTLSGEIMAASVEPEGTGLKIGAPKLLFKSGIETNVLHNFDATGDGQRFVILMPPGTNSGAQSFTVVTNWQASLRK